MNPPYKYLYEHRASADLHSALELHSREDYKFNITIYRNNEELTIEGIYPHDLVEIGIELIAIGHRKLK
jgi:hypothetical protein